VRIERATFESEGIRIVGELRVPDSPGAHPAVALSGPFTGVKEQVVGTYARLLADAGLATLAFDHRGFGESGGRPVDPRGAPYRRPSALNSRWGRSMDVGSRYRPFMPADDLGILSDELRSQARVDPNGEMSWHVRDAPAVLTELADAGRVALGLDMRDYDDDGTFSEIAWSVYDGADPTEARDAALGALALHELPGAWALITWRP